jgi:hypothetical protein
MSRKKNQATAQAITVQPKEQPGKPKIVERWNEYFGSGNLEDWQRLMRDVGCYGEFKSKKACRKVSLSRYNTAHVVAWARKHELTSFCQALGKVWVNIVDFLAAIEHGNAVCRFESQHQLSSYTLSSGKTYPRRMVTKGSPLRALLAHIFDPSIRERKVPKKEMDEVTQKLATMKLV